MFHQRVFITNRIEHQVPKDYQLSNSIVPFLKALENSEEIALDTEYNNLDTIIADLLLVSLSINNLTLVIDATSVDLSPLKLLEDKLIIAQNAKVDFQMMYRQGIDFKNLYDTMIMEQRYALGVSQSNSLESIHLRRLKSHMPESKNTRIDFVNAKPNIVFTEEHIRYSGYDAECLLPIKQAQLPLIKKAQMEYLLYNIEFPFVRCVALSELEGTIIDFNQVKENIRLAIDNIYNVEMDLDEELIQLSKYYPRLKEKYKLKSRKRIESVEQFSLFDAPALITPKRLNSVNYASPQIISSIFMIVEGQIPVSTKTNESSTGEDALNNFLIEYPDTELKNFIELLLKFREYNKELTTYGYKFQGPTYYKNGKLERGYINPVTNKAHTIYRQCVTETGRLASGDSGQKKKNKSKVATKPNEIVKDLGSSLPRYNSQNMPKKEEYRKLIVAPEGQFITTADYSSMELVIAGSLSKDTKLIEIHDKDIHSYLASKCYTSVIRDIISYGGNKRIEDFDRDFNLYAREEIKQVLWTKKQKCPEHIVDRAINNILNGEEFKVMNWEKGDDPKNQHLKYLRDDFKSLVYGLLYGSTVKRIMQVLNISETNAKIVEREMRRQLPKLFKYLDEVSKFGVENGYIIFNKKTNSRHMFNSWIESKRYNAELSFKEVAQIERNCKNYPIQGTSADITKEAAVNLRKHIDKYNINANILLYVHDELVVRHEDKDFGKDVQKIMEDTANTYLDGVQMKATYHTLTHWIK